MLGHISVHLADDRIYVPPCSNIRAVLGMAAVTLDIDDKTVCYMHRQLVPPVFGDKRQAQVDASRHACRGKEASVTNEDLVGLHTRLRKFAGEAARVRPVSRHFLAVKQSRMSKHECPIANRAEPCRAFSLILE